jgi:hypothetical protein
MELEKLMTKEKLMPRINSFLPFGLVRNISRYENDCYNRLNSSDDGENKGITKHKGITKWGVYYELIRDIPACVVGATSLEMGGIYYAFVTYIIDRIMDIATSEELTSY